MLEARTQDITLQAEREKRAIQTRAEAQKEAQIREAEAFKQSEILKAEAIERMANAKRYEQEQLLPYLFIYIIQTYAVTKTSIPRPSPSTRSPIFFKSSTGTFSRFFSGVSLSIM